MAARQQRLGATEPLPVSRNSRLAAARMDDELFFFFFSPLNIDLTAYGHESEPRPGCHAVK